MTGFLLDSELMMKFFVDWICTVFFCFGSLSGYVEVEASVVLVAEGEGGCENSYRNL